MIETHNSTPVFPRRAIVAAVLAAVFAGLVTVLGVLGQITTPDSAVFQFSRGVSFAQGAQEDLRGFVAPALADDRIMVVVVGHTGDAGDTAANLALSEQRAAAARQIALAAGIEPERIVVSGLGGSAAVPKQDGESDRAYQARLARVEVTLQVRR